MTYDIHTRARAACCGRQLAVDLPGGPVLVGRLPGRLATNIYIYIYIYIYYHMI